MGTRHRRLKRSRMRACAALVAMLLALAVAPGLAEPDPRFEGQWRSAVNGDAWDPGKPAGLAQQAPLTPEYQAIFEASLKDQAAGGHGNDRHAACVLDGMPRIMSLTAPMEILIQPGLTFMVFQEQFTRRVHTDGVPMPASELPAFQGYSIGHWVDPGVAPDRDGRTRVLEIETRHFKGPRAMDSTGLPLARDNKTIVRERLYLDGIDKDLLHDDITTIDHAFTRPWTVAKTYRREHQPVWAEYRCQPPKGAIFIGGDEYRLGSNGNLEPLYQGQPPPDLRYFPPAAN
jgi:hypothetical protein